MKIYKRGNLWEVRYRIKGYNKQFTERFPTEEEAKVRLAEIELMKLKGILAPPQKKVQVLQTMGVLLDEFVEEYGTSHWGDSYLSLSRHRIEDYIKPYIGDLLVRDITTAMLEDYYNKLITMPAKYQRGCKDRDRKVSFPVMEKCHSVIRSALNYAVRRGYRENNPAMFAELPKPALKKERAVWTPEDAAKALQNCQDPILSLCMNLSIACSLRIGEILALQWKNVHVTKETVMDNSSYLEIKQELKRCDKASLAALEGRNRSDVFFYFPELNEDGKTLLVLKKPKTQTSIRRVYIPNTVAVELMKLRVTQFNRKMTSHRMYHDYDLVIATEMGNPFETRLIDKMFSDYIREQGLPKVVFHSLRHLSTSLKLQYTNGDIKAVQGDTGHSQPNMVTQVYSHTFDENRKRIASKMEESFYSTEMSNDTQKTDRDSKKELLMNILGVAPEAAEMMLAMTAK